MTAFPALRFPLNKAALLAALAVCLLAAGCKGGEDAQKVSTNEDRRQELAPKTYLAKFTQAISDSYPLQLRIPDSLKFFALKPEQFKTTPQPEIDPYDPRLWELSFGKVKVDPKVFASRVRIYNNLQMSWPNIDVSRKRVAQQLFDEFLAHKLWKKHPDLISEADIQKAVQKTKSEIAPETIKEWVEGVPYQGWMDAWEIKHRQEKMKKADLMQGGRLRPGATSGSPWFANPNLTQMLEKADPEELKRDKKSRPSKKFITIAKHKIDPKALAEAVARGGDVEISGDVVIVRKRLFKSYAEMDAYFREQAIPLLVFSAAEKKLDPVTGEMKR